MCKVIGLSVQTLERKQMGRRGRLHYASLTRSLTIWWEGIRIIRTEAAMFLSLYLMVGSMAPIAVSLPSLSLPGLEDRFSVRVAARTQCQCSYSRSQLPWSVLCVAKSAEQIEMPFGCRQQTRMGLTNQVSPGCIARGRHLMNTIK